MTVTTDPVCQEIPTLGVHEYELAPVAVKTAKLPKQIEFEEAATPTEGLMQKVELLVANATVLTSTDILPVVAPAGTVTSKLVDDDGLITVALMPLNFTTLSVKLALKLAP